MSASEKPGNKQTPEDDTKRKFREALAAKQGRKGEDHIDNGPQHVQAHTARWKQSAPSGARLADY